MKTKTTITVETRQMTIVRRRTQAGSFLSERSPSETETGEPDLIEKTCVVHLRQFARGFITRIKGEKNL